MIDQPWYRLVAGSDLLRTLMRRTGDGRPVSIRALAEAAQIHHSTIGHLLTGVQDVVREPIAQAIADRIGVDLHVLWERDGRTARSHRQTLTKTAEASSCSACPNSLNAEAAGSPVPTASSERTPARVAAEKGTSR
ncbi:helix-turn-helix domain-containing protein [Streptomyces tremellae]|uniref:HTH cro/C1-type domain-containing protein n=1 Tax=Streptomyces tremellae TaxID=1124239 RepID=A0ABP7EYX6_9ACTN